MVRDIHLFAKDIVNEILLVEKFTKDVTYEDFIKNDEKEYAVVRSLEIIGEAANHIPETIKSKYTNIPWTEIIGMRNKITHDYFGTDYNIVWDVVKKDLPEIKPYFEKLSNELSREHIYKTKDNGFSCVL